MDFQTSAEDLPQLKLERMKSVWETAKSEVLPILELKADSDEELRVKGTEGGIPFWGEGIRR